MTHRILLSAPDVRSFERDYVRATIDSNWLAPAGPDLAEFEQALTRWTGRSHAVALSSGTAAIHLALLEVGVGPGDEVLCSTLTFIGSANPIVYCGASPVFVDSEPHHWNMDPGLLAEELEMRADLGKLPKAAIVVDLYGVCAEYDRIVPILQRFDVPLIEDAAEALGGMQGSSRAGSFGRHAVLSFNGNKIITSSGGGAFVTDSAEAAERVRYLSTQARQATLHYEHTETGYNYRMSSICAALGRAQLETLDERIARRRAIHTRYAEVLGPVEGVQMLTAPANTEQNYWLSCATVDPMRAPFSRTELIDLLEEADIESRPLWKPMHLQPVFANAQKRTNGTSEALFETGICLPSGSGMSDSDLDRVVEVIEGALP